MITLFDQTRTANTMTPEAREIALWVENTHAFQPMIESLVKNMKRKIDKGVYDPTLAVKLWKNFLDNAKRHPEYRITYGDWKPTPQDFLGAAQYLSEMTYEAIQAGDYDYLFQPKMANAKSVGENSELEEDAEEKTASAIIEAIHKAGIDDDQFRYAIGEQWVAKVVSSVVEQIVNRPQLFQTMIDGIIDRIKARL